MIKITKYCISDHTTLNPVVAKLSNILWKENERRVPRISQLRTAAGKAKLLFSSQKARWIFAVSALTFVVGAVFNWMQTRSHAPQPSLSLIALLAAVIIGLLVKLLSVIQERERERQDRNRRILELNHHVRNSLLVISHNAHDGSQRAVERVKAEIVRIDTALRQISAAPQRMGSLTALGIRRIQIISGK